MAIQALSSQQTSAQQIYHSFSGFEQMRAQARDGDSEALSGAAKQFESVFVQMMLKAMRDTVPEGGLFDSEQGDFYEGMFDQQISLNIANGKGIGLAEVIERQLGKTNAGAAAHGELTHGRDAPFELTSGRDAPLKMPLRSPFTALRPLAIDAPGVNIPAHKEVSEALANAKISPTWAPASPQAFAAELRPFAQRAAAELGVSENLLIAQAALETGWGQKVIPRNDGGSSFNLFGIKANATWQGDKASTSTLEYRDGIAQRERAEFRAYDSLEKSFDDYVAFLREQPRYSDALKAADDSGFAKGLQSSGYATDPAYAEKVLAVKERLDKDWAKDLASVLTITGDRS
ncbi:MAG: flagellar assembly peptidoglycan hydrolase FlgJ [Gammaproteobacteria bacterium]|nr:flagellar assembly peptidoglycan hydrolase FlgJ [Gammaproteobacteria bacterium]MBQ0839512.1 flagellar assembly peptidoglycan hydrolase FlgJ [Gammaproteobacteria bacterium]